MQWAVAHHKAISGKRRRKLPLPDKKTSHIAQWFLNIGPTRGASNSGPGPITFQEIEAYQRITQTAMKPWEVLALRDMDDAVLAEVRKSMMQKNGG